MSQKPNIIFILADDLGYGDLGCYGQERIQTPEIEKMALEGMRFEDAYAGSPICAPSRCALMTGLHTGHSRIRTNRPKPLLPEDITVAELLKSAGYHTAIFGKWGLGKKNTTGIPNEQGFDHWLGYLRQWHAHNHYPSYLWRDRNRVSIPGNFFRSGGLYSHDLFTLEAQRFIRTHRARNPENPFFLYLAYTVPHKDMKVPNLEPYVDPNWREKEQIYASMVTRLDRDVGCILGLLKELEIDEETIVFFASDNGPHSEGGHVAEFFESSGPLTGKKRDLYEGGIRVPFIARWPGKIVKRSVCDTPIAFWDFLPTAAELAGMTPSDLAGILPHELDGESFVPLLRGEPMDDERTFYWEFKGLLRLRQGVRRGKWKAVRKGVNDPLELYDLEADIGEENDISSDHPGVVGEIENYLKTARTKV